MKISDDILELVHKYNVQGPRYTSYPSALMLSEDVSLSDVALAPDSTDPLSLYLHLPFCQSLCWYCGCNQVITRDLSRADRYLDYLEKEMDLFQEHCRMDKRPVMQWHLGGGTPNFLPADQLRRLSQMIHNRFSIADDAECGVELDPRFLDAEQVEVLVEAGFNRASIGVQDVHPEVQVAIKRIQTDEMNRAAMDMLRGAGMKSINIDLIYGLPCQTIDSMNDTIDSVLRYAPDRLAVYSYAHVPWMRPAQKAMEKYDIPDAENKIRLHKLVIERLSESGYVYIGMDHFAKAEDELVKAVSNGTLQRNFQGYSTCAGMDMASFGVSSISQTDNAFWQNVKDIGLYESMLDEGRLPVEKGYLLSDDDKIRRDVIMKLMCRMALDYREIEQGYGIICREYFRDELEGLCELEKDGLLKLGEEGIRIEECGRLFLRNIAMCFDRHCAAHAGRHSRTV